MRKSILMLILAMFSVMANAQFKVVPGGMVAEDGKEYMVFQIDSVSQQELFNRVKAQCTFMYKSAKDVMSYSEPTIITINGKTNTNQFILAKPLGIPFTYGINYNIRIQFKDGRIRIEAPNLQLTTAPGKQDIYLECGSRTSGYVYDKKGKLRFERVEDDIAKYINEIISELVNAAKNGIADTQEDW